MVPVFNGPVYKGVLPDIRPLLPVLNFPNMIYPTQPVAHSFPSPFPRVSFKNCAQACYRPMLSRGFPVRILRMICVLNWTELYWKKFWFSITFMSSKVCFIIIFWLLYLSNQNLVTLITFCIGKLTYRSFMSKVVIFCWLLIRILFRSCATSFEFPLAFLYGSFIGWLGF